MSSQFWNLPQVLAWVGFHDGCVAGDLLERQIKRFEMSPDTGERAILVSLLALLYDPAVQQADRTIVEPDNLGPLKGFKGEVVQVGARVTELWRTALDSVTRAVRDGVLTIRGREPSPGARMGIIDPTALMRAEFRDREVGAAGRLEAIACYIDDPKVYWTNLRFDATEIQRRWPTAGPSGTRPAPGRNVPEAEVRAALARLADRAKKKPVLKQEVRAQFPGRQVSDRVFNSLFAQLNSEQRRSRGDTDRTLGRRTTG